LVHILISGLISQEAFTPFGLRTELRSKPIRKQDG